MKKYPSLSTLLLLVSFGLFARNAARADIPAPLQDIRIDQRLNEQIPLDLKFRDETGRDVKLGDFFGRRPVILVYSEACASRGDALRRERQLKGWPRKKKEALIFVFCSPMLSASRGTRRRRAHG